MKTSNRILKIKVLMYHRVLKETPDKKSRWHYVTVSEFKKQMSMIDRWGYTPITFCDYQLCREGKLTLPARPIIITFDDGYLDTLENAIPILVELNMRAVIFVMGNRSLKSARWDEQDGFDMCPLMSDEEIRLVQQMGFEIGAHSLNHTALTDLSESDIKFEVSRSKQAIEEVLKEPIHTFSYPYGSINERVKKIVSDSDFSFACGVYSGAAKFSQSVMDFRRLAINQDTSRFKFLLTLLLPYQYIEWFYFRLKSRMTHDIKMEAPAESRIGSTNGQTSAKAFEIQNLYNSETL